MAFGKQRHALESNSLGAAYWPRLRKELN
jgi:hypothetical protein